jgi:hypothetical protein
VEFASNSNSFGIEQREIFSCLFLQLTTMRRIRSASFSVARRIVDWFPTELRVWDPVLKDHRTVFGSNIERRNCNYKTESVGPAGHLGRDCVVGP